ncbi:MAG TPA: tyrosine-protein phosphatase [Jatrophihabitans sp.]|nr:tyrosine-protein phosphatase [Jatrophihabitans sp.]
MTTAYVPNWIELEGVVNVRDVGGLPTEDGRRIRPGVLIRSANLIDITEADVARLVTELGVRRVVDLRTDVEVARTAPGRLRAAEQVRFYNLSLYNDNPELAAQPDAVVPWAGERYPTHPDPQVASYLAYFERRPDSILAALRAIAEPEGATVVHCAAGKDRTGVIVAVALSLAGVPRELIADDYAQTQSQLQAILAQLARNGLYDRTTTAPDKIPPAAPEKMLAVLASIDEQHGGLDAWLAEHGWRARDSDALRLRLVG